MWTLYGWTGVSKMGGDVMDYEFCKLTEPSWAGTRGDDEIMTNRSRLGLCNGRNLALLKPNGGVYVEARWFQQGGEVGCCSLESRFHLTVKTFLLKDTGLRRETIRCCSSARSVLPIPVLREEPTAFHHVDTTCNATDITYYQKEPSIYLFNKDYLRIMLV